MNFNRQTCILFILACLLFISCNKKTAKESVVGKWAYKEMIFLSGNPLYGMEEDQKKAAGADGEGSTFKFNKDGTYIVTPGNEQEAPLTGTYSIQGEGNMMVKNERHPSGQLAKISFSGKDTLKIEDKENNIIVVLERLE